MHLISVLLLWPCTIDWSALGIWIGAAMEGVVAFVILYEVEQHRRSAFLEQATGEEMFKQRRDIYGEFLALNSTSLEERSEAFRKLLWVKPDLRDKCDRQIVLFSKLGELLTPKPISWVISNKSVLQWFPHSVVILWVILNPYIQERRKNLGEWWAKSFSDFTGACVQSLLSRVGHVHRRRQNRLYNHQRSTATNSDTNSEMKLPKVTLCFSAPGMRVRTPFVLRIVFLFFALRSPALREPRHFLFGQVPVA